jgi:hypothetical protein
MINYQQHPSTKVSILSITQNQEYQLTTTTTTNQTQKIIIVIIQRWNIVWYSGKYEALFDTYIYVLYNYFVEHKLVCFKRHT